MTGPELKKTFMQNVVKYWALILTGIAAIGAVAIAQDQIEKNTTAITAHEARIDKLEQIGRDIHNLNQNQKEMMRILLNQKNS